MRWFSFTQSLGINGVKITALTALALFVEWKDFSRFWLLIIFLLTAVYLYSLLSSFSYYVPKSKDLEVNKKKGKVLKAGKEFELIKYGKFSHLLNLSGMMIYTGTLLQRKYKLYSMKTWGLSEIKDSTLVLKKSNILGDLCTNLYLGLLDEQIGEKHNVKKPTPKDLANLNLSNTIFILDCYTDGNYICRPMTRRMRPKKIEDLSKGEFKGLFFLERSYATPVLAFKINDNTATRESIFPLKELNYIYKLATKN